MSLSSREEKLALGVFVVLALGALTIGTSRIRAWRAALWEQESAVETREVEARELRNGGTLWEERRQWVLDSLPKYTNDGEARSSLVSVVQDAAKAHSVSLQGIKIIDPDASEHPREEAEAVADRPNGSALQVTASGDLKSLVFWWQELLQPEHFRQINFLKVTPEDDNTEVLRCSVEIWQWYRLAPDSPGKDLSVAP
jgi:hypothetical protein